MDHRLAHKFFYCPTATLHNLTFLLLFVAVSLELAAVTQPISALWMALSFTFFGMSLVVISARRGTPVWYLGILVMCLLLPGLNAIYGLINYGLLYFDGHR